jgi:molybdate transport system substrate-binding protein
VSGLSALLAACAAIASLVASPLLAADNVIDVPNVAAAADLQFVLPVIVAAFRKASGRDVRVTFGSSGNFRRQIGDGAPFELFLSADAAYADALASEGRTLGPGIVYAVGRLALYTPRGSPVVADPGLEDLANALRDGRLRKLAIANPDVAPYGRAARQALIRAGLWDSVVPRLVLGENVSQAAQFAASGAAQAGIIGHALAISPALAARGTSVTLPADAHDPLVQKMVLLKGAGDTARRFHEFLQQDEARAIFVRHGFER